MSLLDGNVAGRFYAVNWPPIRDEHFVGRPSQAVALIMTAWEGRPTFREAKVARPWAFVGSQRRIPQSLARLATKIVRESLDRRFTHLDAGGGNRE